MDSRVMGEREVQKRIVEWLSLTLSVRLLRIRSVSRGGVFLLSTTTLE